VKARLCVLLVILGLAGVAAPTALADDSLWEGSALGYHDGDEIPLAVDQ
jgi:hypothetical protein